MSTTPSTTLYPMAPLFAVLSAIVLALDIPPLLWHIQKRNYPFITLIAWVLILNLFSLLNALIWPSSASVLQPTYDGAGLCDVQVKVIIGSYAALPCAFAAILRSLAHVLDTDRINLSPTRAQKLRELAIQMSICWVAPVFMMATHYIVQTNRFYLWSIAGCNPSADASLPSFFLIFLWPALFSLLDGYYAVLLLVRIIRYRRQFAEILTAAQTSKSRFLRPVIISVICILGLLPASFYILAVNMQGLHGYSWKRVHNPRTWRIELVDSSGVLFDRWIRIAAGILIFVFFGLGQDACGMYRTWLVKAGLERVFPSLTTRTARRSRRVGGGLSSITSSITALPSRLFGKSKRNASVSTATTSEAPTTGKEGKKWYHLHTRGSSAASTLPVPVTATTATTASTISDNKCGSEDKRNSLASSYLEAPLSGRSTATTATTFAARTLDRLSKITSTSTTPAVTPAATPAVEADKQLGAADRHPDARDAPFDGSTAASGATNTHRKTKSTTSTAMGGPSSARGSLVMDAMGEEGREVGEMRGDSVYMGRELWVEEVRERASDEKV